MTGDIDTAGSATGLQATGALGSATPELERAATDNVGVVRYNVHRSTVAGFVPGVDEPNRAAYAVPATRTPSRQARTATA